MSGFDSYRVRERAETARLVVLGAFLVLIGAFFRTQVVQHEKFQLRAETNRLRPIPMAAPRGTIYDRNGKIIAENVPGYSVKLIASSADSLKAVLRRLAAIVPFDSAEQAEVVDRYRHARYQPAVVFGDASFDVVARLEEHRPALPGLVIQAEPKRFYPAGSAAAHLVGYVGEVTEADLEVKRFTGAVLGTVVGKAGLEREYDKTLRGSEGMRYIEVNARGRLVREEASTASLAPTPGEPIHTTIDLDLQRYIDSIWPVGVRGAMVAMTPDGQIRALYSAPTYDPNVFVGGIAPSIWAALNTDSAKPLLNRAIIGRYPPASPFKLATAAMALRRGKISFDTHMPAPCRGGIQLGNRYFRCWKKEGHGSLDLVGAVAASCDVYFYQLGLQLGLEAILQDGVLMGFRDKSAIDLPSEQNPIYPASTAYFDRAYGPRNWSPAAVTLNFSIGQGENTQTLINMMKFYRALAGNGQTSSPYIVKPDSAAKTYDLGLSDAQLAGLRTALTAVAERGTASAIISATPGSKARVLQIAGKTGTAQNPHGLDHRWFIAMAPADHPVLLAGGIMENVGLHDPLIVRNVYLALRRYVLGPDSAGAAAKVQVAVPETETQ